MTYRQYPPAPYMSPSIDTRFEPLFLELMVSCNVAGNTCQAHAAGGPRRGGRAGGGQGLTLVHFSAQLEPCLTHKHTLHTLNTP